MNATGEIAQRRDRIKEHLKGVFLKIPELCTKVGANVVVKDDKETQEFLEMLTMAIFYKNLQLYEKRLTQLKWDAPWNKYRMIILKNMAEEKGKWVKECNFDVDKIPGTNIGYWDFMAYQEMVRALPASSGD